jgi:hypothetical protein
VNIYENADPFLFCGRFEDLFVDERAEAKLATCQVPIHAGDADIPKAKYKCPQCLIH